MKTHGFATEDYKLVFDLNDALFEIQALRNQKAAMLRALYEVSGMIGGSVGERAAKALNDIENASADTFVHRLLHSKKGATA